MKDNAGCLVDELNCSTEYEENLMECGELLDLMKLTKELGGGDIDVYKIAERIATILGHNDALTDDDDDSLSSSDEDDDIDDVLQHVGNVNSTGGVMWANNLMVAGYTDCMDEAIRFLVEEERLSVEHPIVQGLKEHLVSQQERVLEEAARAPINNQTDANNRPAPAQRVDGCALRPPSI